MTKKTEQNQIIYFPKSYTVIGADLSLKRPGFSKIKIENNKIISLQFFAIDNKTKNKTRGQLLTQIYDAFSQLMKSVECEQCFYVRQKSINNMNTKFARSGSLAISGISQVVGITDYLLWKQRKEWYELYPVTIKKLITENGRAQKQLVALFLQNYVGKQEYKYDDESDAVAVGVAWLILHKQIKIQSNIGELKDEE